MRYWNIWGIFVTIGLFACLPIQGQAYSEIDIQLQVGESMVLPAKEVARVAVGDSRVLNAAVTEEEQVLIFGKAAGSSTLLYWDIHGKHYKYSVQVIAEASRRTEHELTQFLRRIPSIRAEMVGDQIIIEGENISEEDRYRIKVLSQKYPNIVDFTNSLGWEQMVRMDVQIIEIPKHYLQDLGIRWDANTTGGIQAGVGWDWSTGSNVLERPGLNPVNSSFPSRQLTGIIGINALIGSQIHTLTQKGEATILASPQLSARSGSQARFQAGGEVPYAAVDDNGNANTIFKPYGVTLEITPKVDVYGMVRSLINIEVSSVDPSVSTTAGPALRSRKTETEFNVASGETLVLSGFLSRETSTETSGVPFLSDIPLLGYLFRADRDQTVDTELLVFVTPHIVHANSTANLRQVQQGQQTIQQGFPGTAQFLNPPQSNEGLPRNYPYESPLRDQFRNSTFP